MGVPVIMIDGEPTVGFDKETLPTARPLADIKNTTRGVF